MVVVDTKFDYSFIDMKTLSRKDQRVWQKETTAWAGMTLTFDSAPFSHVFITGLIWIKVLRRRSHSRAPGIMAETQ